MSIAVPTYVLFDLFRSTRNPFAALDVNYTFKRVDFVSISISARSETVNRPKCHSHDDGHEILQNVTVTTAKKMFSETSRKKEW